MFVFGFCCLGVVVLEVGSERKGSSVWSQAAFTRRPPHHVGQLLETRTQIAEINTHSSEIQGGTQLECMQRRTHAPAMQLSIFTTNVHSA